MLLSLVSCSQLIFQSFCAPSLSPGPPASGPVECSRLPLCLMYYSVVGIIFTCDNIRYSVYITHICYCLLVAKIIGSCTLPIVSVSVYIFVSKTFFSHLLLQPKAFICLSIPGGKLQEHSQASVSHVKLDVPAPTADCDSIAPWNRRYEKLGHISCSVSCQSHYVSTLFLLLLLDSRSSTQQHINHCYCFHNLLHLISQIILKCAFTFLFSFFTFVTLFCFFSPQFLNKVLIGRVVTFDSITSLVVTGRLWVSIPCQVIPKTMVPMASLLSTQYLGLTWGVDHALDM